MRRIALALGVVMLGPGLASAGGLDLRLGGFFPSADSNLFHDDADLYGTSKSDFNGFAGGIEYSTKLASHLELGLHLDGYGKSVETSYRNYTWPDGGEIRQDLDLSIVPLGMSLRVIPTGRNAKLAPYLAAGVDALFYEYKEHGDFIDFQDPHRRVYGDEFRSDGVALGFHGAVGLRAYVSDDFAIVGEARYTYGKDDMNDDFGIGAGPNGQGYEIDLSGFTATVGLHVRF